MNQFISITWSGGDSSFQRFKELLNQRFADDKFQWKKNDRDIPFQVQFNIQYVEYSPSLIRKPGTVDVSFEKLQRTLCHLFFVDLPDSEKYKIEIRSKLAEWFVSLNEVECSDWLIVFDSSSVKDSKSKNSVLEKLRGDFPKFTSKILEVNLHQKKGLPLLVRSLVEILLAALDNLVQMYESALKTDRENCFNSDWEFSTYFITQLQLSKLYANLTLYDLALAQLEELEATLSLLTSHFAVISPKPEWFENVYKPTRNAISLRNYINNASKILEDIFAARKSAVATTISQSSDQQQQQQDQSSSSSLAILNHDQIRFFILSTQLNVIFLKLGVKRSRAKQCQQQQQVDTVEAQDLLNHAACETILDYGYKALVRLKQEKSLADPSNQKESHVYFAHLLWCHELLSMATEYTEVYDVTNSVEALCNLWLFLCRQVNYIRDSLQTDQSNLAKLKAQFLLVIPADISQCLNDTESFYQQYVKWHESALALLKHKGWNNSANLIGLELARYYKSRHDNAAAAVFYARILRVLRLNEWTKLYHVILDESFDLLDFYTNFDKYVFVCDSICRRKGQRLSLDEDQDQGRALNAFVNLIGRNGDDVIADTDKTYLEARPCWIKSTSCNVGPTATKCGSTFKWSFSMESQFPIDLRLNSSSTLCYKRYNSELTYKCQTYVNSPVLVENNEKAGELICINEKSSKYAKRKSDVIDYSRCCDSACEQIRLLTFVNLMTGPNKFDVEYQPKLPGVYVADHVHLDLGHLSICVPIDINSSFSNCTVDSVGSSFTLEPLNDFLWTGTSQTLRFSYRSGTTIDHDEESEENFVKFVSKNADVYFTDDNGDFILLEKKIDVPILAACTDWHVTFPVFVGLNGTDELRNCTISIECTGNPERREFTFPFRSTLSWTFETHVLGSQCFLVEFSMRNFCPNDILIHQIELEMKKTAISSSLEKTKDKETTTSKAALLNTLKHDIIAYSSQSMVWRVDGNSYSEGTVYFSYSVGKNISAEKFQCWANFLINNYPIVEANCQVASESTTVCRVDVPCDFVVSLKADDVQLKCAELSVKVSVDPDYWQCLGGSGSHVTQVILKENGLGQAFFRLTPRCVGYLPSPCVDVTVSHPPDATCRTYVRSRGKQVHVLAPLARPKSDHHHQGSKTKLLFVRE